MDSQLVQQLQQQVAEMQQMQQQMQRYIITLESKIPEHSTKPPTTTKGLKVATPEVFDGTLSKANTFLNQLSLYFLGRRDDFKDDNNKIIFALSYMKGGTAGPWADEAVRQFQDTTSTTSFTTWESFVKGFKEAFGDPDPAYTARHKMDQLKQGNQTAEEYAASFKELSIHTGYNDAAHMEKFEKGLNSSLVDKIYSLPEMPTSLKGWIDWSTKLDRQWRQREARKKEVSRSTLLPRPPKNFIPSKAPQAREPDVVPMEVDSGRKRIGPITYFKYGKQGHIARNCKIPPQINSAEYANLVSMIKEELAEKNSQKEDF